MVDANVGAVLVTHDGEISGIFTERDYLRRIAVEGRTSRETLVREVMSSPVVVVTPDTSVAETMAIMSDRRIRHAPVVDGGRRASRSSTSTTTSRPAERPRAAPRGAAREPPHRDARNARSGRRRLPER